MNIDPRLEARRSSLRRSLDLQSHGIVINGAACYNFDYEDHSLLTCSIVMISLSDSNASTKLESVPKSLHYC